VSWSGETSRELALVLREWIPNVIQSVTLWVSSEDIAKGKRWSDEIAKELETCGFGIVCVTRDSLGSEWLNFEAGAISKSIAGSLEQGRVPPILLGVAASAVRGPLAHFQFTTVEQQDMFRLMRDINGSLESPLSDTRLTECFTVWWPMLEEKIEAIDVAEPLEPTTDEMPNPSIMEEILKSVRGQERSLLRLERAIGREDLRWTTPDRAAINDEFRELTQSINVELNTWTTRDRHIDA